MYANIIIDISHSAVDRPFSYKIPKTLEAVIVPGSLVDVPFGKGDRVRTGYVISVSDKTAWDPANIKSVIGIHAGSISAEERLVRLAAFIKDRYGSTYIDALKTVMPVKKTVKELTFRRVIALMPREALLSEAQLADKKKQRGKAKLLMELADNPEIDYSIITGKINVSAATVSSLVKQDVIRIEESKRYRTPFTFTAEAEIRPVLSDEQQLIVDDITKDIVSGDYLTYLIKGITGSGKTEVYMSLIEKQIEAGGQAVMLIPEISLTYQNLRRFYRRFGDRVSVIHSKMSNGEKYDQFERVKKGEVSIMIGPRSALFTPFDNLKLIIIDEEHESSYKSETMPKYHATEVAKELARLSGAAVVLGSATPSVDSYYRAVNGEYKLYTMTKRLTGGSLPEVYTVDMCTELEEGNKNIFSRKLTALIDDRLEKGEQIMLFLNRRGMAGFISCRSCGTVIKCPHCDISLSEHRGNRLICHYCGYETPKPKTCPECGSDKVGGFKLGTEKIEELIHKQFPLAITLRMDADTTGKKDDYEDILSKFNNREADILLGTQMIVKGHDFKGVTLMGILAADMSLCADDYKASERTFQLLTQAAGRAGRGDIAGEVVIQTYQPDHFAIQCAARQDYDAFYEEEITFRELMDYPPVGNMLCIQVTSPDERRAEGLAVRISKEVAGMNLEKAPVALGPAKARITKINDIYRQVIYYKHRDYNVLVEIKDQVERLLEILPIKEENVQFDFNPWGCF